MYTTLITPRQLQQHLGSGQPLCLFDCSCDLMNPEQGALQFAQAHIPGARHADLDRHLSSHPGQDDAPPVSGGRHPLPAREVFARWMGSEGITPQTQVVVYDRNGLNYCGRLWWMLKWCGHDAVAVLDGGWQGWLTDVGTQESGPATRTPVPTSAILGPSRVALVDTPTVLARLGTPGQTLIDARAAARYRGEVEPLDPIAGHIPGALNRPFALNLGPDGRFKSGEALRREFGELLQGRDPATVVHHCGSGVSAVPNLLAMQVAGLGTPALYAGSWSEWSRTAGLPVATGAEPG